VRLQGVVQAGGRGEAVPPGVFLGGLADRPSTTLMTSTSNVVTMPSASWSKTQLTPPWRLGIVEADRAV